MRETRQDLQQRAGGTMLVHMSTTRDDITPAGRKAFGAAITARRAELNLSRAEVYRQGGPSHQAMHDLEAGKRTPTRANRERLEEILDWPRGTANALLHEERPPIHGVTRGAKRLPSSSVNGSELPATQDLLQVIETVEHHLANLRNLLIRSALQN